MELFSLRKTHIICPHHRGPSPPALAHESTNFIKCWPLATESTARIKPIELVSLLGCLDPIWRWVAIGSSQPIWRWVAISSSQPMQESPGADLTAEVAGSGRARRLAGVRVFSSYGDQFSIRFATTGSQRWGERVYTNLNRWRATTKPGNGEAARLVLVDGGRPPVKVQLQGCVPRLPWGPF
jgi:hypothetical protein